MPKKSGNGNPFLDSLKPKSDKDVFQSFYDMIEVAKEALSFFKQMCELYLVTDVNYHIDQEKILEFKNRIKQLESSGDLIETGLKRKVIASFINPIDSEDIPTIASILDKIIDDIHGACKMFYNGFYRGYYLQVRKGKNHEGILPQGILELVELIQHGLEILNKKLVCLENKSGAGILLELDNDLNVFEKEGDKIKEEAIFQIYFPDPDSVPVHDGYRYYYVEVIRQLERATDEIRRIAKMTFPVYMKNN